MLPKNPPSIPPASPDQNGLLPKPIPGANPGFGLIPGVGDGVLDGGIDGAEKLRLPRLPDEPPPPALAQAEFSSVAHRIIHSTVKRIKAPSALFVLLISCLSLEWKSPMSRCAR